MNAGVAQPRVQAGHVDAVETTQCGAAGFERVPVGVDESRAECCEHAGAAIVGGRSAQPDEQFLGAAFQRRPDELAHAESAGAQDVSLLRRDQFQSCGGGHLDDGQLTQRNVAVACGDGPAEGVGDLDFDVPAVQCVDDGVDGALAAVGHGHAHAFGVRNHRVHARAHRGDRLCRGHRLLERVRSEDDLHWIGSVDMGFILDHVPAGAQRLAVSRFSRCPARQGCS